MLNQRIIDNFTYEFNYAIHSTIDSQNSKTHQYRCDNCTTWIEFRDYKPHNTEQNIETELDRHLMSCEKYKLKRLGEAY